MLITMTPPKKWWASLVVLTLGLWAGGAAAQSDDGGGWFDEPADTSERPQLKIHGSGQYDPPPPDFRSDPPVPPHSVSPDGATDDDGSYDGSYDEEENVETPETHQRALREFSPRLAPYGYWVDDPFYGRVWVPNRGVVGSDFRPYVSGGHWQLTANDEWLWASDYPFGSITFHYGRWAWLSSGVGWGWVPGYVYSPAWVDFRIGSSGYVGWGPAPPYSVWRGGAFVSIGFGRPIPYIFCPTTYVFSRSLPRYVVRDRHRVRSIAAQTSRYRPRYVDGASYRVRSPTPREARIPNRYVPTRRVIAQPRGSYVGSAYRGRDRGVDARRSPSVRGSSPREFRSRTAPLNRSRGVEARPRSRSDRSGPGRGGAVAPSQRIPRGPSAAPPRGSGTARQSWSSPGRTPSETRRRDASPPERRASPPPRARDDGGRSRSAPERRDSAGARRGGESRGSARPARGGSSGQQRSRSRDDR